MPVFSVWFLVAVAVDLFYAVARPLSSSPMSQRLKEIILFLWVWSTGSSTDVIISGNVEEIEGSYQHCDSNNEWTTLTVSTLTFKVLLPLVIIVVLYTIICCKLWSREIPGDGTNQNQGQAEAIKTARKVTRMMIVIAVLFFLCWLPFCIAVALQYCGVEIN